MDEPSSQTQRDSDYCRVGEWRRGFRLWVAYPVYDSGVGVTLRRHAIFSVKNLANSMWLDGCWIGLIKGKRRQRAAFIGGGTTHRSREIRPSRAAPPVSLRPGMNCF